MNLIRRARKFTNERNELETMRYDTQNQIMQGKTKIQQESLKLINKKEDIAVKKK